MLKKLLERGIHAEIIDEHNKITITDSSVNLREPKGSIISLIPISECHGVTTQNLEYPLYGETLYVGEGRGVSNCTLGGETRVSLKDGLLLVVVARD